MKGREKANPDKGTINVQASQKRFEDPCSSRAKVG